MCKPGHMDGLYLVLWGGIILRCVSAPCWRTVARAGICLQDRNFFEKHQSKGLHGWNIDSREFERRGFDLSSTPQGIFVASQRLRITLRYWFYLGINLGFTVCTTIYSLIGTSIRVWIQHSVRMFSTDLPGREAEKLGVSDHI